jgi:hypothetical protein
MEPECHLWGGLSVCVITDLGLYPDPDLTGFSNSLGLNTVLCGFGKMSGSGFSESAYETAK